MWMVFNKDRLENLLFAFEVIVQPPQGNPGLPGYLAHRSAVVPLLDEQVVRRLDNFRAGSFSPAQHFIIHNLSPIYERTFVHILGHTLNFVKNQKDPLGVNNGSLSNAACVIYQAEPE
jgi:hypothetical protein